MLRSARKLALPMLFAGTLAGTHASARAQEIESFRLVSSPKGLEARDLVQEDAPSPALIDSADQDEVDTIRDRFPDGRVRIERQMKLDANGNFIHHGSYQEWTNKGDLVATGSYQDGLRQGAWIRVCQAKDSKLFETYPYSKCKFPLQSSVEFESGQMEGVWTITDADNKTISQIQLSKGKRDGIATFYHPNGQMLYQADYKDGILHGSFLEKNAEGKIVRDDRYHQGQKSEMIQETYPSKTIKSQISYLTAPQRMVSPDNFDTLQLADFSQQGERIQHGPFVQYHPNGQMKVKGAYEHGKLVGTLESWHSNGQLASSGTYENGTQNGKWVWWHENGMRKAMATYSKGRDQNVMAWNEQGQRINNLKTTPDIGIDATREYPVSTPTKPETFR